MTASLSEQIKALRLIRLRGKKNMSPPLVGDGMNKFCRAKQYSDMMSCDCGLEWDINTYNPPKCRETPKSNRLLAAVMVLFCIGLMLSLSTWLSSYTNNVIFQFFIGYGVGCFSRNTYDLFKR